MKILSGSVQPTFNVGSKEAERVLYFAEATASAFCGVYGSTNLTSTKDLFDIAGSTFIQGKSFLEDGRVGTVRVNYYTTGTTGSLQAYKYYMGTTSTWAAQNITTGRSAEGMESAFIPIKSSEGLGFGLTATSLAAQGKWLVVTESGLPYPRT